MPPAGVRGALKVRRSGDRGRRPAAIHPTPARQRSDKSFPATKSLAGGPQRIHPDGAPRFAAGHRLPKHLTNPDRKSTRLNSSHLVISYAVFCLKKKKKNK